MMQALQVQALSSFCTVRRMAQEDAGAILALYQGNPQYFDAMQDWPTLESVRDDLTVLPPGRAAQDKFFVGFYLNGNLAAVMDLILGYPDGRTAFIGLFMVDAARQGRGLGSRIVGETLACVKALGYCAARLGYVQGNAQSRAFWEKNGFAPTGAVSEREKYVIVSMGKQL